MRTAVAASVITLSFAAAAGGEQSLAPPASVEALRVALEKSKQPSILIPAVPPWVAPSPTRVWNLTFVPPDTNGEMVTIALPIGELLSHAARGISDARRARAERKADERVRRDLQEFLAQHPQR